MAQARYGQLQQQKPGIRLAPIAITLLALLALEIGTFLPLPGINLAYVAQQGGSLPFQSGLLARISVLALGMVPWFSALTIVELVRLLLPRSWLKGVSHAQPFSQLVIGLSLTFALMQGYGVTSALVEIPEMVAQPGASFIATGTASLVAGNASVIALALLITRKGLGHGFWIVLAASMLVQMPEHWRLMLFMLQEGSINLAQVAFSVLTMAAIVALTVAILAARQRAGKDEAGLLIWPLVLAPLINGRHHHHCRLDVSG